MQEGKKVLLIDDDPQGQLSISLGYSRPDTLSVTLSNMMGKDLPPKELLPIAQEAVEQAQKENAQETEMQAIQSKIDSLTANLDKMYMDRLSGLLAGADFERIYSKVKLERSLLEEKREELELRKKSPVRTEDMAKELVQRFVDSAFTSWELLVSLIERVELTEEKQITIKFCFQKFFLSCNTEFCIQRPVFLWNKGIDLILSVTNQTENHGLDSSCT